MKPYLWILIFMLIPVRISAQQLPRYSQYIENEFLLNPSIAGYDGRTTFTVAGRKEWIGFTQNTPETYSFSAQTRILKSRFSIKSGLFGGNILKSGSKGRVGLGCNIYSDNNAAIRRTGIQFIYAYHIFIRSSQLSFGLGGSLYQFRISKELAQLKEPGDPLDPLIGKSTVIPDANFGLSFINRKFHFGISAAQLFQSKMQLGPSEFNQADYIQLKRHYYLIATYRETLKRKNKWEYEPSLIFRTNDRFQVLSDLSLKFFYNREYWFGISARTSGDLILIMGLKVEKFYFGYSFDYGFNGITRFTKGSHEITLALKLGDSTRRYRWIERY